MTRRIGILIFFLTGLASFFLVRGQSSTLCVSNPVGTYHVFGLPGSTFSWDTQGDGVITGQGNDSINVTWTGPAGNYTLSVIETSPNGCIGQPQILDIQLVAFASSQNIIICSGQSYTLPDGAVVSAPGSYPVTLTSAGGCDSIVTTDLAVVPVINTAVSAQICSGQSYTLPDGAVVSAPGSYPVTLTSAGGCDSIVTTDLAVVPVINTAVSAQICSGQSYTLPDGAVVSAPGSYPVTLTSAGGCDSIVTTDLAVVPVINTAVSAQICTGQSYTLPDGAVVSAPGSYPVTLTSAGGCDSIVTTDLAVVPVINTAVSAQICSGQSYTLPDGAVVSAPGSYPVTLTSAGGCDSIVTTDLTVKASPIVNLGGDQQFCNGDSITLDAGNPGSTYIWNTGESSQQIIVKDQGNYFVDVNNNGCSASDTVGVTVQPNFTTSLGPDQILCEGTSTTLDPQIPGGTYQWNTGEVSQTISVSTSGDYSVIVTKGSCTSIFQVEVEFSLSQPVVVLGNDTLLCLGDSLVLIAPDDTATTYQWQDGSTGQSFTVTEPGVYILNATNSCGTVSDTVVIDFENCSCGVFVPNAFTPNNDGVNDYLQPMATCEISNLIFQVFNRWYEKVFETTQINSSGWDGTYLGEEQTVDVYIYYLSYLDLKTGKPVTQRGTVTLLK